MKLTGENRRTREKTCPSATLSTTNHTWTDPGSNPGLRGERPATNRLSHGTADLKGLKVTVTRAVESGFESRWKIVPGTPPPSKGGPALYEIGKTDSQLQSNLGLVWKG
jgi:hypothetical protein